MKREKMYITDSGMAVFPFCEESDELTIEAYELRDIDAEDFNQEGYDLVEKYSSFDGPSMKDRIVELVKLNPNKPMLKVFEEDYLPKIQENLINNADAIVEDLNKEGYEISKEEYLKIANSSEILGAIFDYKVTNPLSEAIFGYFVSEKLEELVFTM